jgi:hypothetical protein
MENSIEKPQKRKLDYNFLTNFCIKNNITLTKDYSKEYVTGKIFIEGLCSYDNCNQPFIKRYCEMLDTGGYCRNCTYKNADIKRKQTCEKTYGVESVLLLEKNKVKSFKYTYEALKLMCAENNVELIKDYSSIPISANYNIEGKCVTTNCLNTFKKPFCKLYNFKLFTCKKCTYENAKIVRAKTNLEVYGVENCFQNEEIKQQIKETNIIKYGTQFASQNTEIIEKIKQTNLKKFGYTSALKNPNILNKMINTNLQKYGVKYSCLDKNIINKRINTNLQKYGVQHPFQSVIIKNKIKNTVLNKYGVDNILKNKLIFNKAKNTLYKRYGVYYNLQYPVFAEKQQKNSFKLKEYIFPSGRKDKIQGFEHFALNDLLNNEHIDENVIITGCSKVPIIWYYNANGQLRRHFVDIFIYSQNRCIEVKSTWTLSVKKDNVFLKQTAAKEKGYNYEIWVYDKKGNIVEKHI